MRITAAQRKWITSLSSARRRREEGLFVAEGLRSLRELVPVFGLRALAVTSEWLDRYGDEASDIIKGLPDDRLLVTRNDEMARMSALSTPQGVMGVFEIPAQPEGFPSKEDAGKLILALDRIQDPGNLGTIIRVADWFGVNRIVASEDTVDIYNAKVIQATMGALARVRVIYAPLPEMLTRLRMLGMTVYGTFLDGENLYASDLTPAGVIVMGNEGNGISGEVAACVDSRISIPSFPPGASTVESLNVGTATAVTVAEFRRRQITRK